MALYSNPRYDLNGDVIVQMLHNGKLIDITMHPDSFIPNGVTYEQLKALFVANQPEEIAAYDGLSYDDIAADDARVTRSDLLASTDLWGLADYPATAEQTAYRQALRDITAQAGFPTDITWPTKPAL
tara:strand:+ start:1344 stop:1724 length:381 start_codon:yes stop_codon:yes gene_type:complete